jgi:hypothetical protein
MHDPNLEGCDIREIEWSTAKNKYHQNWFVLQMWAQAGAHIEIAREWSHTETSHSTTGLCA